MDLSDISEEETSSNDFINLENWMGNKTILPPSMNTWTKTDEDIVKNFCQNNHGIIDGDGVVEENHLDELMDLLAFFSREEVICKIKQLHEIGPSCSGSDGGVWTKKEEDELTQFILDNPCIKSGSARTHKKKDALINEVVKRLHRFTKDQIKVKIVDIAGSWRNEDVETVISFYRDNCSLWNSHLADYHNKGLKSMLMSDLCSKLEHRKKASEVEAKFQNMKKTFMKKSKAGPTGSGGTKHDNWPYMKLLEFLVGSQDQRESINTLHEITPEDGLSDEDCQSPGGSNALKKSKMENVDDEFKRAIVTSVTSSTSTEDSFAASVSASLNEFTPVNRSFVKMQLQAVLAHCLQYQEEGKRMPNFKPE